MSDFTNLHRPTPHMTREAYLDYLQTNFNRTEEDLINAGLVLNPCPCGHDFCAGWLIEKGPMPGGDKSLPKRMGRPPVGDTTLLQLTVPAELKADLEAKALSMGMTVPDARRQALYLWLGKDYKKF